MCQGHRALSFVSAAAIVCLLATAGARAQQEGDDPFGEPLGVEATNPFDGGSEAADPFDNPIAAPATKPAAASEAAPPSTEPTTPVFYATNSPEQNERIQRVLREPLNSLGLEFSGAPLNEVVNFVRDEYNIEVQLDLPALDDLGISSEEHIDVNLRNISLGAALRILLRQLDLTYVIDNEVLLITSEEEALTRLQVAVYPVGDILAAKEADIGGEAANHQPERMELLIDVIISTVAADTWVDNGGPDAEICPLQPGLLVVSQTQDVHRQIAYLLNALRVAKQHDLAVPHRLPESGKRFSDQEIEEAYRNGEQLQQGGGVF